MSDADNNATGGGAGAGGQQQAEYIKLKVVGQVKTTREKFKF